MYIYIYIFMCVHIYIYVYIMFTKTLQFVTSPHRISPDIQGWDVISLVFWVNISVVRFTTTSPSSFRAPEVVWPFGVGVGGVGCGA